MKKVLKTFAHQVTKQKVNLHQALHLKLNVKEVNIQEVGVPEVGIPEVSNQSLKNRQGRNQLRNL